MDSTKKDYIQLQESRMFIGGADSPHLRSKGEELAICLYEAYQEIPHAMWFISLIRVMNYKELNFFCLLTHRPEFREVVDTRYESLLEITEKVQNSKLTEKQYQELREQSMQEFPEIEKNFKVSIKYGIGELYFPIQFIFDPSGYITINLIDPIEQVVNNFSYHHYTTSELLHLIASDQIHKHRGRMPIHILDDIHLVQKNNPELLKVLLALKNGNFQFENIWCSINNPEEWYYQE